MRRLFSDFPVLNGEVDMMSQSFKENTIRMKELTEQLEKDVSTISLGKRDVLISGGDQESRKRHLSRGKLLPRDRIDRLLDPGYDAG